MLLRPIVQDTLFPTICYVAGPSELAYLGQLREVYEHFGVPMPLVYPRATATLVDSATARFLNKYDVPLEDLQPQDEAALEPPAAGPAAADRRRSVLSGGTGDVGEDAGRASTRSPPSIPTLAGAAKKTSARWSTS